MEVLDSSLSLIALFPLLGAFCAYFLCRKNKDAAGWIATGASLLSFLWVLKSFYQLPEGGVLEDRVFTWFALGDLSIDFMLRFDQLTAVMALVVTGVGTLIHLYSIGYMAEDESRHRFFSYLNLFMFSMLLLVLGGNLVVMFVGWEGVGLCSYLLIGFWFKNFSFAAAGRKAFVVNRIGDAGFLLGIFLVYVNFGTLDFVELSAALGGHANPNLFALIAACFFVGAAGKSAQIPLFVWLPDAMAGPTPVSALIHAATMVTAGIYMMARLHYLFELAPATMAVICVIAVLTAIIAATIALVQNDIKKVLAYSTVSQLGFMFMAASVGAYWVAIFHVVTHAFFKACLFLGAGSVIHSCHHEQDMRKMGGLAKLMPITCITYGISTLAIAGIFPFAGYQSKHAILYALQENINPYLMEYSGLLVFMASLTAFLTAFYMTRSFVLTFLGSYRGHAHPHESPWKMSVPLIVLAALAVLGGLALENALPVHLSAVLPFIGTHTEYTIAQSILASWVGLLGLLIGYVFYARTPQVPAFISKTLPALNSLFAGKYFIDEIYQALIVKPLEKTAGFLYRFIDQGVIDGTVNGAGGMMDIQGEVARATQTGQVRHYAFFIFIGTLAVIVLFFAF